MNKFYKFFLLLIVIAACNPEPPILSVNKGFIEFEQFADEKSFTISNDGKDALDWSVELDSDWLTLSSTEGKLKESESEEIIITVSREGLDRGIYGSNIKITSNGGEQDLIIELIVPITPEDQIKILARTWYVRVVTYESSVAITEQWEDFRLTFFSDKTYVTENAADPGPWTNRGTWDFIRLDGKTDANHLIRDDGLTIQISTSEQNQLNMLMFYNAEDHIGTGGNEGDGEYSYTFFDSP